MVLSFSKLAMNMPKKLSGYPRRSHNPVCVGLQLSPDPLHCHLDERRLAGYWMACRTLTGSSDSSDAQLTPYCLINNLIKTRNYQVRTGIFSHNVIL